MQLLRFYRRCQSAEKLDSYSNSQPNTGTSGAIYENDVELIFKANLSQKLKELDELQ